MERKGEKLLSAGLALVLSGCLSKSQPIVGRDVVSPVIQKYGEIVHSELAEQFSAWSELSPEDQDAWEKYLAGFSNNKPGQDENEN